MPTNNLPMLLIILFFIFSCTSPDDTVDPKVLTTYPMEFSYSDVQVESSTYYIITETGPEQILNLQGDIVDYNEEALSLKDEIFRSSGFPFNKINLLSDSTVEVNSVEEELLIGPILTYELDEAGSLRMFYDATKENYFEIGYTLGSESMTYCLNSNVFTFQSDGQTEYSSFDIQICEGDAGPASDVFSNPFLTVGDTVIINKSSIVFEMEG